MAKAAVREKKKVVRKDAAKPAKAVKKAAKQAAKPKQVVKKASRDLRLERFVAEYLIDFNGRRAAVAAGYSADTARVIAYQLLQQADVQALIQARQAVLVEKLEGTQELVIANLLGIIAADPRDITGHHMVCCRYCWGKGFKYQMRAHEREEAREIWLKDELAKQVLNPPGQPTKFNEQGGIGFTRRNDPNPNCPACDGEGESHIVFKDTRDLSPAAKLLYAGVEQTQHGLKIRTNSQTDAVINLGKHLGMFGNKKVELSGPNGGPVQHTAVDAILALIDGADVGVGPAASRK